MTRFAWGTPAFHVAQLNVARLRSPLESPEMLGFVHALDPVNALADRAPGFVWRLKDDHGHATDLRPWGDDVIVNLSVWSTLDHLRDFVFSGHHAAILRDRRQYFDPWGQGPHTVLFWVPSDEQPTLAQARSHLDLLADRGPSPTAFTFATPFLPDPVTGLSGPVEAVVEAERRAAAGQPPVVVLLDVDDLGAINAAHGHLVGDLVLGELAIRIRGALPPAALLARSFSDEFVVLAAPGSDAESVAAAVERAVAATPVTLRGHGSLRVRVSATGGSWQGSAGATIEPLRDALAGRPALVVADCVAARDPSVRVGAVVLPAVRVDELG
jgi:diguanylate cyclase (GGDEF)-like protein